MLRSWSAPVPPPDVFYQYDEDVRKRIIEYADANIVDESKRQDKMVDAIISSSKSAFVVSMIATLSGVIGATVAFIATKDPASLSILGVSAVSIVVNIFKKDE